MNAAPAKSDGHRKNGSQAAYIEIGSSIAAKPRTT